MYLWHELLFCSSFFFFFILVNILLFNNADIFFLNVFNIFWVFVILSKYIKSKPSISHHHLLTQRVNFPENKLYLV